VTAAIVGTATVPTQRQAPDVPAAKKPARRRKPVEPCPAWCTGKHWEDTRGRLIGHHRLFAEIQRPAREQTPMQKLMEDLTGRRPGEVEVHAEQLVGRPVHIDLTVADMCAMLTPDEAVKVGWALLNAGLLAGGEDK
jgi:hypothetical protein